MTTNTSKALKRVLANIGIVGVKRKAKLEGIYLSNEQLEALAKKLRNYKNENGVNPDGICFMIGKYKNPSGITQHTVEYIPYVVEDKTLEFYVRNGVTGMLNIMLPPAPPNGPDKMLIIGDISAGSGGIAQKTPPPGA